MSRVNQAAGGRAVVLGGGPGVLALARSLCSSGVEVWLVNDTSSCASYSAAVHGDLRWAGAQDASALDQLDEIARTHGLLGSILIPAADPEVRLVAQAHRGLSSIFSVLVPPWDDLQWACDKSLAYQRAELLGVGAPQVYRQAEFDCPSRQPAYPLVLKPSMRLRDNRFTSERGWRVDDRPSFDRRYKEACELVGAEHVLVQQMIPGGGDQQLSYAGFWHKGQPVVGFTARRLRQYPVEFGCTSTYVETASLPDVERAAELFLRSIRHHGLVEIEFKRDPRDGRPKLLDVNPRPWNWLGLAAAAGIDLGGAISRVMSGQAVPIMRARPGVGWMFASRDIVSAARSGRPAMLAYAGSWTRVRSFACFQWSDPLPALTDLPLSVVRAARRRRVRRGRTNEEPA